ncbi:MAG: hypothetical protein HYZ00_07685, partial [Candidatus Hydrogenedentes bacterium]|nr:hypothetical protein [Candidatus Hydrogenedentota bacterium]
AEDVALDPWVTLAGAVGADVAIEGFVAGANNSALVNLSIVGFSSDEVLLAITDMAMWVEQVTFLGDASLPATGILVEGAAAAGTIIEGCTFSELSAGIDISDALPLIRQCVFEDLSTAGIIVRAGTDVAGSNSLGESGTATSGWNTFAASISGNAVVNLDEETIVMEQNDWSEDTEAAVDARISGPADFTPFLAAGNGQDAATLHVIVWDSGFQSRITTANVTLEGISGAARANDHAYYDFPLVPGGVHTVDATAPRYQPGTATAFLGAGAIQTLILPLTQAPKRAFFGCGGATEQGWDAGDLLVAAVFSGMMFIAIVRGKRSLHAVPGTGGPAEKRDT